MSDELMGFEETSAPVFAAEPGCEAGGAVEERGEAMKDRQMLKFPLFRIQEPCCDEFVAIHAQPSLCIAHVGMQDGVVTLWALCDLYQPKSLRTFRIVRTGQAMEPVGHYLGTVLERSYVWHIFEVFEGAERGR